MERFEQPGICLVLFGIQVYYASYSHLLRRGKCASEIETLLHLTTMSGCKCLSSYNALTWRLACYLSEVCSSARRLQVVFRDKLRVLSFFVSCWL